ncbi:MAG: co-chaperone GroES [Planctomycetes bacterium]|nr:co-chaperone GroES [Planctomycetota bacterium]
MSKSKLQPIGSHIIVQRASAAEKSAGGIIIPEKGKEKPKEGKVVAVGNGKMMEDGKRQGMQLKAGDRVLFSSYAGTEVKVAGEEYLVMEETDVFAVIE